MRKIKGFMFAAAVSIFVSGCGSVRPELGQVVFASPSEAVASLKEAAKKDDAKRLMEILGSQGKDIVFSGDVKFDSESRAWFARKADEKTDIVRNEDAFFLELGNDRWPFLVPIEQYHGKYFFNSAAGLEEMLNRRIGRNELDAIKVCSTLVTAEEEYAKMKLVAGAVKEYASKLLSEKGLSNGLYWDEENSKDKSPVGALIVLASQESPAAERKPYHGYFYKLLSSQGPAASGGAKSYLVDGKMLNGFAFVAYPASYGVSGIKTFIVSKNGIVFEKDLGKNTASAASEMVQFNPDETWMPVAEHE